MNNTFLRIFDRLPRVERSDTLGNELWANSVDIFFF